MAGMKRSKNKLGDGRWGGYTSTVFVTDCLAENFIRCLIEVRGCGFFFTERVGGCYILF